MADEDAALRIERERTASAEKWAAEAEAKLTAANEGIARKDRLLRRLEQQRDRDHDELRDRRTDDLNVRGILSPNGHASRVPDGLLHGPDVAPAIEWLVNRVAELESQLGDDTQWGIRVYVAEQYGERGSHVLTGYTEAAARHHAPEFTHRAEPVYRHLGPWIAADISPNPDTKDPS